MGKGRSGTVLESWNCGSYSATKSVRMNEKGLIYVLSCFILYFPDLWYSLTDPMSFQLQYHCLCRGYNVVSCGQRDMWREYEASQMWGQGEEMWKRGQDGYYEGKILRRIHSSDFFQILYNVPDLGLLFPVANVNMICIVISHAQHTQQMTSPWNLYLYLD